MTRLLIAEDEERMRRLLGMLLSNADYELELVADGREALNAFRENPHDVVITDLRMPNMSGMELIKEIREDDPDTPIIVITAFGSIESAVDAMRAGATDYITKPFEEARIKLAIQHAVKEREMRTENRLLRKELRNRYAFEKIVCEDKKMLKLLDIAHEVALANTTVIVYGESGTGKELVARAIHLASPRSRGPFIALNCAAIPENLLESELFGHERGSFTGAMEQKKGRFEMASGGTLFLDEIGEMDLSLQAKLLRALESQEFERVGGTKTIKTDIRFVAATNKNLRDKVSKGLFRDDLFYRLNVFPIVLPPLRERKNDIIPLTEFFLNRFAEEMGKPQPKITREAEEVLLDHRWLGNVRELQNVIERAMILIKGSELTPDLIQAESLAGLEALGRITEEYEKAGPSLGPSVSERQRKTEEQNSTTNSSATNQHQEQLPSTQRWHPFRIPEVGFDLETHEKELIEQALVRSNENKSAAAKLLGLSRATLRYRLEKYGFDSAKSESEKA
ncbi:MAG: sigma-54-dependent transcriptional regulator [Sumerlaeia bacterium]